MGLCRTVFYRFRLYASLRNFELFYVFFQNKTWNFMKAFFIIAVITVLAYWFWRGIMKFMGMFSDHAEEIFYDDGRLLSQSEERKSAQPWASRADDTEKKADVPASAFFISKYLASLVSINLITHIVLTLLAESAKVRVKLWSSYMYEVYYECTSRRHCLMPCFRARFRRRKFFFIYRPHRFESKPSL